MPPDPQNGVSKARCAEDAERADILRHLRKALIYSGLVVAVACSGTLAFGAKRIVAEDAAYFGCAAEIAHARTILTRGTSAHAQRRIYEAALAGGAAKRAALDAVVDWLIEETQRDL